MKSVLIVEDEYLLALDLKRMLEECGWKIRGPVANTREAFRLLREVTPSVALLDVNLGGEYVTPVAEYLSERGVPFALVTANGDVARIGSPILTEAPVVSKPATRDHVLAVLARIGGD